MTTFSFYNTLLWSPNMMLSCFLFCFFSPYLFHISLPLHCRIILSWSLNVSATQASVVAPLLCSPFTYDKIHLPECSTFHPNLFTLCWLTPTYSWISAYMALPGEKSFLSSCVGQICIAWVSARLPPLTKGPWESEETSKWHSLLIYKWGWSIYHT